MTSKKYLIVNADDFGQSSGVNRGIIEAHEHGIVTSASLMVRWPAAAEAALYSRNHPSLSLGIHIDLGEWQYRGENWQPLYEIVNTDDRAAVATEVANQLALFERLTGTAPTHIDSHQHVHLREPVDAVLLDVSRELHIPLRHLSSTAHYCGEFYGQTAEGLPLPHQISLEHLIDLLSKLPSGLTELGCHPGYASDLNTTYRNERASEVEILCDPRVRAAITTSQIELCSFISDSARQPRQLTPADGSP